MNINGKEITEEIKRSLKEKVAKLPRKPRLDIIYVGANPVIEGFLRMKRKAGEDIGMETKVHNFPSSVTQEFLIEEIRKIAANENSDGMIVQLPLPSGLDADVTLNAVPTEKDIDVLSAKTFELFETGNLPILPPVVGAIVEILKRNRISVTGKNAVVFGNGRLVGKPVATWLEQNGAKINILDNTTGNPAPLLKKANIIISGAGVPGLIKPDMISQGVILFDAGASEEAGKIKGDADLLCADKCAIFTPVPGGIGPITVAILFKNLLSSSKKIIGAGTYTIPN